MFSPRSSNYERLEGGMGPSRNASGRRFAWTKFAIGAVVIIGLVYFFGPRREDLDDYVPGEWVFLLFGEMGEGRGGAWRKGKGVVGCSPELKFGFIWLGCSLCSVAALGVTMLGCGTDGDVSSDYEARHTRPV